MTYEEKTALIEEMLEFIYQSGPVTISPDIRIMPAVCPTQGRSIFRFEKVPFELQVSQFPIGDLDPLFLSEVRELHKEYTDHQSTLK